MKEEDNVISCFIIVEDDEGMRTLLGYKLAELGYPIHKTNSGKEAVELIRKNNDALVLIDHSLPDMTGSKVIKTLNSENIYPNFIFMTGYGNEQLAVDMMKSGALDYVVKDSNFIKYIVELITRILKKMEYEKKIIKSEIYYHQIIETANIGILTVNNNNEIIYYNKNISDIFAVSINELKGRNVTEIIANWDVVIENRKRVNLSSGHKFFMQTTCKILSNKTIDIEMFYSFLINVNEEGERNILTVGIINNITERKRIESELDEYRRNLEEIVSKRTLELSTALEREKKLTETLQGSLNKEKEISELKSRFVSMASHEFRTPLTTIMSSSDVLLRYGEKLSEEDKKDRIKKIQANVKHMTRMMDDVLLLGRDDRNKDYFLYETFSLSGFMNQLCNEIRLNDRNNHNIIFNSNSNDMIKSDKKILRIILSNIITNAVKYSPEGTDIIIDIQLLGDIFYVKITDSGIGIPEDEIKNLFEPFHRCNNVGKIAGTGLGLAIVKKM